MIQGEHEFDKVIGIDPGMGGGIAVYTKNGLGCAKMPNTKVKKGKKTVSETDINSLKNLLESQKVNYNPILFLERVQGWLSDSEDTNPGKQFRIAKLLANYEMLKAVITIVGIPFIEVHPRDWQGYLNLVVKGEDKSVRKNRYKTFAAERYPGLKANAWNADAVCLVEFGRRRLAWDMDWINKRLPESQQLGI